MTTQFNTLVQSATTANGAATNYSSMNKNVDLFFLGGASRGKDINHVFSSAFAEDPDTAVRVLQWIRDARGGAGERETFRALFKTLIKLDQSIAERILVKLPELGRWDDVLSVVDTPLQTAAFDMVKSALLTSQDRLAAKWMPRNGELAVKLRNHMGMSPKQWRKLLVGLSSTVEQYMCAGQWSEIVYPHVPSVAAARYQRAFTKHDPVGYRAYRDALEKGTTKINAAAVYPYDIIRSLKSGDAKVASAQWASLPDYLEGSTDKILPVVDVSGSMGTLVSGSVSAMDVAISLGLYISERNNGTFKNKFITFSENPKMQTVAGNLADRYSKMSRSDWGMSTDLEKVFTETLATAVREKTPADEMPTKILILSDMEFNQCIRGLTAMESIKSKYRIAGYDVPGIIFWNIAGRSGNSPVKFDEAGTALVSGFSPSIMTSLLSGKGISPLSIMLDTVMVDRYNY